ncbi:hypothetical protein H6P81_000626 [Aristolochia fimbriata]|uniref:Nucleoside phosphorylase domain-containing protein n=1 Tax=Aristolochia fimbriata TaxID=158543 RepID=A0AAV7F583_ARIFI|nr:hypothetical protein H6P81_000626 [Aristolochia fimbriata]
MKALRVINDEGPYLGIVVPNAFEMNPLLHSSSFAANEKFPFFDFAGRRFRIGKVGTEKIVLVMTGLGMLNAGLATQLLISLFNIRGVLHYGIAGNANPSLQIGDRSGDGPNNELSLESNGDYTRKIGYLMISNYTVVADGKRSMKSVDNLLNNVWYQPEEIFRADGTPEARKHAFWVPVDISYFNLAKNLEGVKLGKCINSTTCLPREPVVKRVSKGCSASVFVDNAAYRQFLYSKFDVTPIDMESSAVALVCNQQKKAFITIRALSDLAGGGPAMSNEVTLFDSLATQNAVDVAVKFVALISRRV